METRELNAESSREGHRQQTVPLVVFLDRVKAEARSTVSGWTAGGAATSERCEGAGRQKRVEVA